MSYGSEIDLLYVYDAPKTDDAAAAATQTFFVKAGCDLTAALSDETHEGYLYRVGPPSWPAAGGWLKAYSIAEYADHYATSSDARERWALLRARPVAGDADLGRRFIASSQPFVYGKSDDPTAAADAPEITTERASEEVERFTQDFQLRHGAQHATLRSASTLTALEAMGGAGLIDDAVRRELDHAYVFLRSAEHRRQLGLKDDLDKQVAASHERVRQICRGLVDRP